MAPVLSAEGKKTQWLNYATGVKNLFFRMKAIGGVASISIELVDRDITQQQFYFHQLERQKSFLHHILEEEWIWTGSQKAGTGSTANVSKTMTGVSIDRREDWPQAHHIFQTADNCARSILVPCQRCLSTPGSYLKVPFMARCIVFTDHEPGTIILRKAYRGARLSR